MDALQRHAPTILLGLALAVAGSLILVLTTDTTFYGDSWGFIMTRRDLSLETLLHPHNEHIVVFPVLIDNLLLRVFGLESARPEQLVLVLFLLVTAVLFYVYVKRRVGPWLALMATVLILFLGPAWEVLLWPFEITLIGPVLFGLAMLLALEREDRRGDIAASIFLFFALGFSNLGVAFLVAAVVAIAVGPRDRWLRRSYVFVVPGILFAVWYLGWGSDAESSMTLRSVLASPQYVADAAAIAVGSLFGQGVSTDAGAGVDLVWSRVLLVGLVGALAFWKWRHGPGVSRWLWPILAALATSWFLTAFNLGPGRDPSASRYQYAGVILVLMLLANLLRDVRPNRNALLVCAGVTAFAVGPNLVVLKTGSDVLQQTAVLARSNTAALEIAERTVDPDFQLTPQVAGTPTMINVYAGEYEAVVDEFGSPAFSEAELASAPPEGRHWADIVLGQALPLSTTTQLGEYRGGGGSCTKLGGDEPGEVPIEAGTTRVELAPGPPAEFSLRRFAEGEYPVSTAGAEGESVTELTIPADRSPRPWYLQVSAAQPAWVCPG
jgi:hypothetical protein